MPPKQAERWRWHLKVALASAIAGASRLQQHATRAREQRRPLILGYHRVVENFAEVARTEMPSMLISRRMFEQHIDWIGRTFRFVTLDEIGEHMLAGAPFIEPVAAVTFDDGYRDVHEHALPVLKRKGIPAAMFVVTNLVGQPSWQIHDKLYHLMDKAFATWSDPQKRLFDVLMHEIAHHTFQQYKGKRAARVARTAHHEALAERFAVWCRLRYSRYLGVEGA